MKKTYIILMTVIAAFCSCDKNEYDASGVFEATTITVSAEASGRILSLNAEEGDILEAGQEIGVIDTMQLYMQRRVLLANKVAVLSNKTDASKQVAAYREQMNSLLTERQRVRNLIEGGAAPRKMLDDIEGQIEVLKRQIEAVNAQIGTANTSADGQASSIHLQAAALTEQMQKCHIVSPIKGTVLMKYTEAGETAVAGHPLMKIADTSKIFLRAYFSSEQLASIQVGQKVQVIADYGGDEQVNYEGTVNWISSESEFTPKNIQTRDTRTNLVYAVKIAVKNDGKLKIGMAGQVKIK